MSWCLIDFIWCNDAVKKNTAASGCMCVRVCESERGRAEIQRSFWEACGRRTGSGWRVERMRVRYFNLLRITQLIRLHKPGWWNTWCSLCSVHQCAVLLAERVMIQYAATVTVASTLLPAAYRHTPISHTLKPLTDRGCIPLCWWRTLVLVFMWTVMVFFYHLRRFDWLVW